MHALLALLLIANLGVDRDLAPRLPGPNPGQLTLVQLLPRPGGFMAIYVDGRPRLDGTQVGLRMAKLGEALELIDTTGIEAPVPGDRSLTSYQVEVAAVHGAAGLELVSALQHYGLNVNGVQQPNWISLFDLRVDDRGAILRAPLQIARVEGESTQVASLQIALDGPRALVAWVEMSDMPATLSIKLAAVGANGDVEGPWTVASHPGLDEATVQLTLATSGQRVELAWLLDRQNATSTIEHVQFASGAMPGPSSVLMTGNVFQPALAPMADGGFFLAWMNGSPNYVGNTPPGTLAGLPIAADGSIGAAVQLDSTVRVYQGLQLASSDSGLRFLSTDTNSLASIAGAVTQSGVLRDEQPMPAPFTQLACNGAACIAGGTILLPQAPDPFSSYPQTIQLSRLGADSSALDAPPLEISFPADAETALEIFPDRANFNALFLRAIGRDASHLVMQPLSPDGQNRGDAGPVELGLADHYAAASPSAGGVLIATELTLSDPYQQEFSSAVQGQYLAPDGTLADAGAWASQNYAGGNNPLRLACAQSRCGLLYQSPEDYFPYPYRGTSLDPTGQVLGMDYVAGLGTASVLAFGAAGSQFVLVVPTNDSQPMAAQISDESAFPAFGSPIPLARFPGNEQDVALASSGSRVAVAWVDNASCAILGRALDLPDGGPLGADAVNLYSCENGRPLSLTISPRADGFRLLYQSSTADDAGVTYSYYQLDTDLELQPKGPARLLDRRDAPLQGLAATSMNGQDHYSYIRFDDSPGVSAVRAKITVLDGGAELILDAGPQTGVSVSSGCACSSTQSAGGSLGPAMLLLLALGLRRKRSLAPRMDARRRIGRIAAALVTEQRQ